MYVMDVMPLLMIADDEIIDTNKTWNATCAAGLAVIYAARLVCDMVRLYGVLIDVRTLMLQSNI